MDCLGMQQRNRTSGSSSILGDPSFFPTLKQNSGPRTANVLLSSFANEPWSNFNWTLIRLLPLIFFQDHLDRFAAHPTSPSVSMHHCACMSLWKPFRQTFFFNCKCGLLIVDQACCSVVGQLEGWTYANEMSSSCLAAAIFAQAFHKLGVNSLQKPVLLLNVSSFIWVFLIWGHISTALSLFLLKIVMFWGEAHFQFLIHFQAATLAQA